MFTPQVKIDAHIFILQLLHLPFKSDAFALKTVGLCTRESWPTST